jgi:DNA-binding GntR family transcriptional regulator
MSTKLELKLKERNFSPQPIPRQISEILSEAILEGSLKPGTQLLEISLQQQFGVSRSPLREAFSDLEKKGLVVILPRRGAFVREVTIKDISENFVVRAILEGLAARLAHKRMSSHELDQMQNALEGIKKACMNEDRESYRHFHESFHQIFIKASKNDLLIGLLENLRMTSLFYYVSYRVQKLGFQQSINKQHEQIFKAFKNRGYGEQELENMVRNHINGALELLFSEINNSELKSAAQKAKTAGM